AGGGGAPGPMGCSLPAALEAGCPLRVGRSAVPAAEESRATGQLPAASDVASSLRAVPPGAGLLRAGLEPRDLPGPTPRYRQPWKTRTAADRTCGRPVATAARPGPAGRLGAECRWLPHPLRAPGAVPHQGPGPVRDCALDARRGLEGQPAKRASPLSVRVRIRPKAVVRESEYGGRPVS